MLPKKRRISRKEFPELLRLGRRLSSSHLLTYIQTNNTVGETVDSKFSFSISKKVCKNAKDRNKYRRQGYSVINKHKNIIKPGLTCLFVFKKDSKGIRFETIEKEILELLSASLVLI